MMAEHDLFDDRLPMTGMMGRSWSLGTKQIRERWPDDGQDDGRVEEQDDQIL